MKDFSWPISTYNELEYLEFKKQLEVHLKNYANKNIYIFGAGIRGCEFLQFCKQEGVTIEGIIDNDSSKWGGTILKDYSICSLEKAKESNDSLYVIISVENSDGIILQLQDTGLKEGDDFFYIKPVLYDSFINEFYKPDCRILAMGDCIFSTIAVNDIKKESLGEMIRESFSEESIKILQVHGMGNHTFYHMLRLQIALGMTPHTCILAVNTVMFAGKKNQLPRAQHTPLLQEIARKMPLKDEEFDDYIELTDERMKRFNTDLFVNTSASSNRHNEANIVRLRMKQNYIYNLDIHNEGMEYLLKIQKLCVDNNIRLLLLFPPINYVHGNKVFGEVFENTCRQNMELVKGALTENGSNTEIIDMSFEFDEEMFAATDTINELTNYEGRRVEADIIRESYLNGQYNNRS